MKRFKKCALPRRLTAILLCACMVLSLCEGLRLVIPTAHAAGEPGTAGVTRQADPSTMDTYTKMLDFSTNTRYAGRLWSDKSVFALGYADKGDRKDLWNAENGTLTLTKENDGLAGEIGLDEDFLHVYSALGSSMEIVGVPPVRTVIVFDNSGSMYNQTGWENTRIAKTVDAINAAIDVLMLSSEYNEVSVVLFGDGANGTDDAPEADGTHRYHGNSTAVTILPMKHYEPGEKAVSDYKDNNGVILPSNNTQYLTASWSKDQTSPDGDDLKQTDEFKGEGGWVFVNNEICQLKSTDKDGTDNPGHKWYTEADWNGWNGCGTKTYTAYSNGTTNIQAGIYQGMQELLNANKTEQVGNQVYQCVPSLVLLTDGAVTDALDNWLTPTTSNGVTSNAMGFVCDFSYKGVSFVQKNDPDGTDLNNSDRKGTSWNQFLAVKGDKGTEDPKRSASDEAEKATEGDLYYEAVASADAGDKKISYEENVLYNDEFPKTTKVTGDSLTAMQALANQYRDNEAYMIFNYLLTTAYYKQAVKSAYNVSGTDDWSIYTITVDMPDPTTQGFNAGFDAKDATKAAITSNPAMMNPGKCFNIDWLKNSGYLTQTAGDTGNTYYDDYTVGDMTVEGIQKAIQAWETWKTAGSANELGLTTFRSIQSGWNFLTNNVKGKIKVYKDGSPINQVQGDTYDDKKFTDNYPSPGHSSFWRVYAEQKIGTGTGNDRDFYIPTKADATTAAGKAGFKLGDLSYDYVTKAYYASTAGDATQDLAKTFEEIVDAITAPLFTPVAGANDLGVEDSVTYMDPMGKYMEVKDVKNLSLFGTLYDITKTAVYDYQWNDAYMNATGLGAGTEALPEGWYNGEPTAADYQATALSGKTPDQMWAEGWVYRVNYRTAAQFVPSLYEMNTALPGDAVTKMQNTVYTFYRIADEGVDRNKLHMNPAYGDKVPAGLEYSAENPKYKDHLGVYALSDLRIWVEDSGDYNDSLGDALTDTNYDEALWINIPVNMLPLRTVSINLGSPTAGHDDQWSYTTNLDSRDPGYKASFPLRVFYTVGVSDEVLENNRINMAGAISPEYVLKNKITTAEAEAARGVAQGNVEFFSNWYNPLNRYGDYATTNIDYTYGDPVTSFSPASDNRYYLFEKALPLYSAAYQYANGVWTEVEPSANSGGRLLAVLNEGTDATEIASKVTNMSSKDGDIVLLKDDILDDVTKPEGEGTDPFSSDGYYFLAIEFYDLGENDTATWTQYVITRKGSEFGSAYSAAEISNGDMLVWHDVSGKNPQDYPYLSFSETGDRSRGKDYIGAEIDPNTGWYKDVEKGKAPTDKHTPTPEGEWVVCAKPGGLRVGDLSQAVQEKGGDYVTNGDITSYYKERYPDSQYDSLSWGFYSNNVTRTANNYYMPTISTASSAGADDIIVNTYLGNNGRLYVADTTLLVTKTVESLTGEVDNNEEFNFQVFINGITGTQSAVVVRWNETARSWQRQFHYIDLELDGQLFLQTEDGQKAMVDKDGKRVIPASDGGYVYADDTSEYSGTVYYVYIGKNQTNEAGVSDTGFRVYHNNDVDENGVILDSEVKIVGSTFKAATVWLVSESKYNSAWNNLDPIRSSVDLSTYCDKYINDFELLTIDSNISDTTEITISTPYRTSSAYWTKELTFGVNAGDLYDQIIPSADRPDYFAGLTNETIAASTAEFTLKNGQALLFSGIPNATVYRVTERLTDAQMDKGYSLKEVSHTQQVGSTSTYRPGAQLIPVYYKDGTTYLEYGGGAYPDQYKDRTTEKGLMWAVNQAGEKNDEQYLHYEPFHHTNAVVWNSYSTLNVNAQGDNHHQPAGVPDGSSTFWLWDEASKMTSKTDLSHTVQDNPNCTPLADGGCDEDIGGNQVRHYFFKDGVLRDLHYEGEGSGYIRNIGRYITSPTVHFGVYDEDQAYATKDQTEMKPNTNYNGVYSVFGNTGTYEESANFVNTFNKSKSETAINGDSLRPTGDRTGFQPGVQVGDTITYTIEWANTTGDTARVVIIDPLDDGVDYVGSTEDGVYYAAKEQADKALAGIYGTQNPATVDEGHVVIWNLGEKGANEHGSVTLTVRVNGRAAKWWDYDGDGVADAPVPANPDDYMVRNRATVRVADNSYYTNTIVNPVGQPDKTETNIDRVGGEKVTVSEEGTDANLTHGEDGKYHGPLVYVGDQITYEITWRNYEDVEALITIRDPLDKNVSFVSAKVDSTELIAPETTSGATVNLGTAEDPNNVPEIVYDAATHTVTWNLGAQPAGAYGTVTLTVEVLSTATPAGCVDNTAYVKVNGDPEQQTKTIENPTPETQKTETTPGDGELVKVGQNVTYTINWKSNVELAEGETLTSVTVTDKLDPGVDFVSASEGSTYDSATHTVTWTFTGANVPTEGSVSVTVRVTARALVNDEDKFDDEDYRDNGGIETEGGQLVQNRASVSFNHDTEIYTNTVKNPVGPEKEEATPGDRQQVQVGDEIHYRIHWQNYKDEAAAVVIEDPLDPGVDFVKAVFNGMTLNAADGSDCHTEQTVTLPANGAGVSQNIPVIQYFNGKSSDHTPNHCVVWNLGVQPSLSEGWVDLYVKVNSKAVNYWQYGTGDTPNTNDGKDHEVVDRASVQVGNDTKIYTDIVENPIPEKTETKAGASTNPELKPKTGADNTVVGPLVNVGDAVTYTIKWKNAYDKPANVVITDALDPGVDFVSADNGGIYDEITHTVTWTLLDREPNSEGAVTLMVKVNSKATPAGKIDNQAKVTVGDSSAYTGIVENPTPELKKTEVRPGEGMLVKPGDQVDYTIHWNNYKDEAAVVTVTDELDPGVDFVSAEFKGVKLSAAEQTASGTATLADEEVEVTISYDQASRTITWTIGITGKGVPAQYKGDVYFSVIVNKNADRLHTYDETGSFKKSETGEDDYRILNQGGVQVGNDAKLLTEIIPNPTEPVKDEAEINDRKVTVTTKGNVKVGPKVTVGDEITYTVTWQNTEETQVRVVLTDTMSDGLEYVAAGVVTVGDNGELVYGDAANGVLTHNGQSIIWTFTAEAGASGMVWVKARVTADAVTEVKNGASVKVGDKDATELTPVENPVTAGLTVKKTVTGSGDRTKEFHFTVTLGDRTVTGTYGDMDFTNGVAEFTLSHGESKTARNLPSGTTYTVTEAEADQDGYTTSATGAEGVIPESGNALAEFTNYKPTTPPPGPSTGNLTVTKTVTGVGDKTREFHFTVTLSDRTVSGVYGEMTFNGGVAEFTLSHGQSKTARNLPSGTTYTVTEAEANQDGYATSATGDTGRIPTGGTVTAKFVNDLPEGEPHKTEVTPGDGEYVSVGDAITYRITWKNNETEAATVTVRDPLDVGVDFVSASDGGVYDAATHTVTWTFADQPAGASGAVTLVVRVNAQATVAGKVVNQAFVRVGNNPEVATEIPENPTGEPHKTEVTPGDGLHVSVGDEITYEITWQNYELETATVVIRDPLDEGVDFVSADNGGVYDASAHTVTWTLPDQASGASGAVRLVVKVNAEALEDDMKVVNQAFVKVGNNPEQATEIPENPTDEKPHKTEVTPGDGEYVSVGDAITYRITWKNNETEAATVTVRDPLDVGVDFVSASDGGVYDAATHTVTWTFADQPTGASGAVTLVVRVNANAVVAGKVVNQAFVRVGNNPEVATEIPENPTGEPHKTEVTPGDGLHVSVGDEITYEITWQNYELETATVVIRDPLDVGVDFVSADNGGVYDAATHTVTWTLPEQAAGASGAVRLVVKVNAEALEDDMKVVNQAFVKVGNNPEQATEIPENPTDEKPHKTEVTPGDGETVRVGDEITYRITWINDDTGTATVTVRDPLDRGVDFVSADNGGVYDAATHTVTWTFADQPTGASGTVTLVVRVNANAVVAGKVVNQAFVRVGNNPEVATEIPENPTEQTGSLTVTKEVIGSGEALEGKTFAFTVTGPDGYSASFVLAAGGSVTLKDLKPGAYTVTEANAQVEGYILDVTGGGQVTVEARRVTNVTVTNTYTRPGTGNLTVTKTVSGNVTSNMTGFHFTVTLSEPLNGVYGGMTFTNGVAEFTLRHGQSRSAAGLPAGITYTVTEAEANQDGYVTTEDGSTGTIPDGGTARAAFLNTRDVQTVEPVSGPLAVRKLVTGSEGEPNREFHFRVTLSEPLNGTYGGMEFVNGVAEFTLRSGEVMWGRQIPVGTQFTVEELDANQDGYTTVAQGTTGEIMDAVRSEVRFQNHRGPWTPEDDEPWEEIPDPEIPLAELPNTGDERHMAMWLPLSGMSFVALLAIAYLLFSKNRIVSRKGRHVKQ